MMIHSSWVYFFFSLFFGSAEGVAFRIRFFFSVIYGQKGISLHHFHKAFLVLVLIVSVKLCRNAQHIKFTNEIMNYVSTGVSPYFFYLVYLNECACDVVSFFFISNQILLEFAGKENDTNTHFEVNL